MGALGNGNQLYICSSTMKSCTLRELEAKLKQRLIRYHKLVWLLLITIYLCLFLEIDLCADSPCKNNATCQNFKTYHTCTCLAGFQGVNCETGI